MKKIGINLKINVNDINKAKLFKGDKGNYLNLVTFVELENADKYGNNGFVKQQGDKNEDMPILGNIKIFWKDENSQQSKQQESNEFKKQQEPVFDSNNFDDELPF